MTIKTYKTSKIIQGDNLYEILDDYLPKLKEKSVVAITSKIISLCQKRITENTPENKKKYIQKEADYYLSENYPAPYGYIITIKNNILIPNSGIDESNGNGYLVLWPKNLQKTTNNIWTYLKNKNKLNNLGIIVTDSKTSPLRWGTTGICLSWCGIEAFKNYINTKDIFGRLLKVTKSNIVDGLASASVMEMGEGSEQTPLAVLGGVSFIKFQNRPPSNREIALAKISLSDDLYSPILASVMWKKNAKKRS